MGGAHVTPPPRARFMLMPRVAVRAHSHTPAPGRARHRAGAVRGPARGSALPGSVAIACSGSAVPHLMEGIPRRRGYSEYSAAVLTRLTLAYAAQRRKLGAEFGDGRVGRRRQFILHLHSDATCKMQHATCNMPQGETVNTPVYDMKSGYRIEPGKEFSLGTHGVLLMECAWGRQSVFRACCRVVSHSCNLAWHGMAWHGMAWHGMAWHGLA